MPTGLQCRVMSPMRAARDPPMKTLLDPVWTSKGGMKPPQATARRTVADRRLVTTVLHHGTSLDGLASGGLHVSGA